MCGLLGIFFSKPTSLSALQQQKVLKAARELHSRGPDGDRWAEESADDSLTFTAQLQVDSVKRWVLYHRLLKIADSTDHSMQPYRSMDGQKILLYNGELYPYRNLRAALGGQWRTGGDTEIFLELLTRNGNTPPSETLTSHFAYCLVDLSRRTLTLGRDPFGVKPLYFSVLDGALAVASIPNSLIALQDSPLRLCRTAALDYLCLGLTDHSQNTMIGNIQQLPPGTVLKASLDQPQNFVLEKYWQPDLTLKRAVVDRRTEEGLLQLLRESVADQTAYPERLALGLSGGLDSSAILGLIPPERLEQVSLFTYVADQPGLGELAWAEKAAGTRARKIHQVHVAAQALELDFRNFIRQQGEPCGGPSHFAQFKVCQEVGRQGLRVFLEGHGGDELFAGYPALIGKRLASLLKQRRWHQAFQLLKSGLVRGAHFGMATLLRAVETLLPDSCRQAWRTHSSRWPKFIQADWLVGYAGHDAAWDRHNLSLASPSDEFLRFSLIHKMLGGQYQSELRCADRNAMAHGLENRVPFLNPRLFELLWSLPEEHLLELDGSLKPLLRKVCHGIVPGEILQRQDKLGYATPEKDWIEGSHLRAMTLENLACSEALRSLIQVAPTDRLTSTQLWRLASFTTWYLEFGIQL